MQFSEPFAGSDLRYAYSTFRHSAHDRLDTIQAVSFSARDIEIYDAFYLYVSFIWLYKI